MSSDQFNLIRYPNGDIAVRGGVVIDATSATGMTKSGLVGYNSNIPPITDPVTNSYYPPPSLSGGSGFNIFIFQTGTQVDIPFGTFYPLSNSKWANGNGYNFTIEVNPSNGQLLIKDSIDTVAIATPGRIRLNDRLQCSSASSSGGPGTFVKTVDLGTGTGTCSFQFTSTGSPCVFTVVWNSTTVINVTGSGTVSFSKSISGQTSAVVTIQSPAGIGSGWSFNLGCPGGGAAPYSPPSLGSGQVSFTAASTTYGNSLNGGSAFTLSCMFENGLQNKTAISKSDAIFSANINFAQDGYQRYYESIFRAFELIIKSTGAELRDAVDSFAIRPVDAQNSDLLTDPTGIYESTAYGLTKFGLDEPFTVEVQLNKSLSISGNHAFGLKFLSGALTTVEGPIFYAFQPLPNNSVSGSASTKLIPVGTYDSTSDTLLQLWEGPILLR